MFVLRVIEKLDVVEHVLAGFLACFVFSAEDAFAFEQFEEALDDGILPAVRSAANAGNEVVLFKELLPLVSGELGALNGLLSVKQRYERMNKYQNLVWNWTVHSEC